MTQVDAADPLAVDVQVADYASSAANGSGEQTRIASARLQSTGTRGAHTINAAARSDMFDAAVAVHGGWNNNAWTGSLDTLTNRGRYALTLAAPARSTSTSTGRPASSAS